MLDGMTNIKAREVLKELKDYTEDLPHYSPDEVAEALEMAIKDLEQQPSEDCVSRIGAINVVHKYFANYLKLNDDICLDGIRSLPPVTPQQKRGKWIRRVGITDLDVYFECSECGKKWSVLERDDFYCSKCGSDNSDSVKDWFDKWDSEIAKMEAEHE